MNVPADKYLLKDYRDDMRTPDAPQWLDTQVPLMPVKAIGTGFPKPNSKQRIKFAFREVTNTAVDAYSQLGTTTANLQYYFVGCTISQSSQTSTQNVVMVFDATTGNFPAAPQDEVVVFDITMPASVTTSVNIFAPYPILMKDGLRLGIGAPGAVASATRDVVVWYLEEQR